MKVSDLKGEAALDALADLLEPITEIITDEEFVRLSRSNAPKIKLAKAAIKGHKKAIIEILAILDGVPPEEYEVNLITLPKKLLEVFNDPDVASLFQSRGQVTAASSGSAMVNTGASEA